MKNLLKFTLFIFIILLNSCSDGFENTNPLLEGKVRFEESLMNESGDPVQGLRVAIWADDILYEDFTDESGLYSIDIDLEKFPTSGDIALVIQGNGYRPKPATYRAPLNNRTVYSISDNTIYSCPNCISIINGNDVAGDLFHLGDDSFTGSSNSQFQKAADNATGLHFRISPTQAGNQFEVIFLGKGIQHRVCDQNRIIYGNQSIELSTSPDDGSYALQRYNFSTSNASLISLIPSDCGDVDDWEFFGLHIQKK